MTSLVEWTLDDPRRFRDEIVRFNHRIADSGLFSDEALAELLDDYPRDNVTICTMQPNPAPDVRWIAGEAKDVSGKDLMTAVRAGALWVSPRNVMSRHPRYRPLFDAMMSDFCRDAGTTALKADAAILISAPKMGIFFHVDPAETMLWHVRGHKTIYIYPPKQDIVTEQALEAILLKETLSDLPYRAEMEAQAIAIELEPGEAVSWPIHSPHRVVNGDDLNVSVSIEFSTTRSMLTNGVFYVNGVARRQLGWSPVTRGTPAFLKPAYLAAAQVLKKLNARQPTVERSHERQFDVDLSAPGCIRWRPGYGPVALKVAA
ncbi:hypothetical protein BH11PSE2_BH11PSE2_18380 [soil metagenome]